MRRIAPRPGAHGSSKLPESPHSSPILPESPQCAPILTRSHPILTNAPRLTQGLKIITIVGIAAYQLQAPFSRVFLDSCGAAASVFAASHIQLSNISRSPLAGARLAPTTVGIYCNPHARPAIAARPRGKRRQGNQLNFRRRNCPVCTEKFNLPNLVIACDPTKNSPANLTFTQGVWTVPTIRRPHRFLAFSGATTIHASQRG
jgi:hypothetical protein